MSARTISFPHYAWLRLLSPLPHERDYLFKKGKINCKCILIHVCWIWCNDKIIPVQSHPLFNNRHRIWMWILSSNSKFSVMHIQITVGEPYAARQRRILRSSLMSTINKVTSKLINPKQVYGYCTLLKQQYPNQSSHIHKLSITAVYPDNLTSTNFRQKWLINSQMT